MKPNTGYGLRLACLAALMMFSSRLQADEIQLTINSVAQRTGTKLVDISYNLSGAMVANIQVEASDDNGVSYQLPVASLSGDHGRVIAGYGKTIVWNAGTDWDQNLAEQARIRLTARKTTKEVQGGVMIGDTWGDGPVNEKPAFQATLSPYLVDELEVTVEELRHVLQWAYSSGYVAVDSAGVKNATGNQQVLLAFAAGGVRLSFTNGVFSVVGGEGSMPCRGIPWYGAAAYCNYASMMAGLDPCYDLATWGCNPSLNGYRLPSEVEWEAAARGGTLGAGTRYSGSDNPLLVAWHTANGGALQRGGLLAANELGLFDMSGNVTEWCNDWYSVSAYSASAASPNNPRGPATGTQRVRRGGGYASTASNCRVSVRTMATPVTASAAVGFRVVRTLTP